MMRYSVVLVLSFMGIGFVDAAVSDLPGKLAAVAALGNLTNAPAMYVDDTSSTLATVSPGEMKAVYFDALDYLGSPTRVYARVGLPSGASAGNPVPGVVLVHGGGGTAFSDWVELWTNRGYAAISIAVEGQTDSTAPPTMNTGWHIHAAPGPVRVGIYGDTDVEPITDQWMYHAVADTVLANSLLRALPEVVSTNVGLMGISWGGVITSTAIGIDNRFKFAVPTYGCGNLDESLNSYGATLSGNERYKEVWDPMVRITNATMPVLWYSWPTDWHFALDCQADCYGAAPGQHMVSLVPGMGHGHGSAWNRPESYDFADSVIAGTPWCLQQSATVSNGVAEVTFASTKTLDQAMLVSTIFGGHTGDRIWTETEAVLVDNGGGNYTLSATLPDYTTAWFINGISGSTVASSDFQETGVVPSNIVYSTTANWSTQNVDPNDPVSINNGATVTLDQSDEALMLTITESASLQADQDVTLAVGGLLEVDDGTVNQSAGLIAAHSVLVNSASQYNLTGGGLATESVLDINNDGLLNMDGGIVAKDLLAPATNDFSLGTSGQTTGLLNVQSGGLQITNGLVYGVINQYAKLEVSGGDVDLKAQFRSRNEIKVVGDDASIDVGWLNALPGASFVFELDETGVSTIDVSGWMGLVHAAISVDGSAYTGGAATILLMDSTHLTTLADVNNISLTGFAENGLTASIVQQQAPGHYVQLVIEELVANTVIYDTSTNWASQAVNDIDEVIIRNGATVTAGQAPAASSNLIVNGSFEVPDIAGEFAAYGAGNPSLSGWTLSDTGVVLIDSFDNFDAWATPAEGSHLEQFLQLQTHSGAGAGTISQTFATEVGKSYTLMFDYSIIFPSAKSSVLTYNVGAGGQTVNPSVAAGENQAAWQTITHVFTAADTNTTLSFTGAFEAGFWGASVDHVRVTTVAGSSDVADTLIVNDDASPTTATLQIDDDFDLAVTTSIELGAGTGAGYVNQSTGTVSTANLTINSSGTGDLSQYTLSGGALNVSGSTTINDPGVLDINGGTFIQPGNGTISGGGLLKLQSGSFSAGNGSSDGHYLRTNVEISGGSFSMLSQILFSQGAPLEFTVIGDAASITMRHLQFSGYTGSQGTLKWILNETGLSTINMTHWMFLDLAKIVVDGSAYTGGSTNINLIDGVSINGLAAASNITVSGFAAGYTAEVVQDAGDVRLEIIFASSPYETWADGFGLSGSNALAETDVEPDGLNNLLEYALGGDPTNGADTGYVPTIGNLNEGGTNWVEYVYARRIGSGSELGYYLELTPDLVAGVWTNTGYVELPNPGTIDADFESVTNRIDTIGKTNEFIRLRIEEV